MHAIGFDRHGAPGVLRLMEAETPSPRPGEVLIKVEAAGVSHADTMQRSGNYPPPADASPILGLEVAGTIALCGEGVDRWKKGDEVCALVNGGGYAAYVTAPQEQVLPVPQGWSFIEAATLPENAFTVYDNLVTRARLRSGEVVLVHGGSSGIGSTAIMFAVAIGATAISTAGSDAKCEACRRFGAAYAINYRTHDFVAEVTRLTEGRGVNVILDIVGGDYILRDLAALALDGRIACIAMPRGRTVELDLGVLFAKRATIMASSLRPRSSAEKGTIAAQLRENIWPLLPARNPIFPVVDSVYPFASAAEAHRRMESSAHIGKIVLTP